MFLFEIFDLTAPSNPTPDDESSRRQLIFHFSEFLMGSISSIRKLKKFASVNFRK